MDEECREKPFFVHHGVKTESFEFITEKGNCKLIAPSVGISKIPSGVNLYGKIVFIGDLDMLFRNNFEVYDKDIYSPTKSTPPKTVYEINLEKTTWINGTDFEFFLNKSMNAGDLIEMHRQFVESVWENENLKDQFEDIKDYNPEFLEVFLEDEIPVEKGHEEYEDLLFDFTEEFEYGGFVEALASLVITKRESNLEDNINFYREKAVCLAGGCDKYTIRQIPLKTAGARRITQENYGSVINQKLACEEGQLDLKVYDKQENLEKILYQIALFHDDDEEEFYNEDARNIAFDMVKSESFEEFMKFVDTNEVVGVENKNLYLRGIYDDIQKYFVDTKQFYFEAKLLDVLPINEFKAVLIPKEDATVVKSKLEKCGYNGEMQEYEYHTFEDIVSKYGEYTN
jgi:hypothetical protein